MSSDPAKPVRRLGVIGDVHGEHDRLAAALDWLAGQGLDAVICTGDIADGAGCVDRCCALLREAGVLTVAGNHDRWLLSDRVRHVADAHRLEDIEADTRAYLEALPRTLELATTAGPLLLCHGIGEHDMAKVWPGTRGPESVRRCEPLDALLAASSHRFIVHGHLHYRVLIDFESLLLMNAGTLKGDRGGVSVADFEADEVAAYDLAESGGVHCRVRHSLTPSPERRVWSSTAEFDGAWDPVLL
ncbi:MAG: metallophosphoesterase [Gammaproteobacteria bacterium]|nr:metallophosphoesterase [Gammaproteobacteria bacterium]